MIGRQCEWPPLIIVACGVAAMCAVAFFALGATILVRLP